MEPDPAPEAAETAGRIANGMNPYTTSYFTFKVKSSASIQAGNS